MRKFFVFACIVMLIAIGSLFGAGMESLYPLVVPFEYTSLKVGGCFPEAIRLNLELLPFSFAADIGGIANYEYQRQSEKDDLDLNASAKLAVGTTSITTELVGEGVYKSYSLDLIGMPGFYTAGGNFLFEPAFVGGATSVHLDFSAFGGVGIGRIYNITTIRLIELMMKHLGVTPTEENVKAVAEIMATSRFRLDTYADDTSKNFIEYYRAIADAMGAPDKILELIYIGNSQRYAFERNRYGNLNFGWEAQAHIDAEIRINTTTDFNIQAELIGKFADFLMEGLLHYDLIGLVNFGYNTSFGVSLAAQAIATYLPDNPQWWATASAAMILDSRAKPIFEIDLRGEYFYQLQPNLTLYAGVLITDLFSNYAIKAGGNYRIW